MKQEKPSSKRHPPRRFQSRATRVGRAGRRGGVALLEFALVVPLVLAMLLGIIDFGQLERATLAIANGAREGARLGALGRATSDIRGRILNVARPPLETDASGNILNGSIKLEQATQFNGKFTDEPWPPDMGTSAGLENGVARGNYVRVTILYNHRSITGLLDRAVSIPVLMRRDG